MAPLIEQMAEKRSDGCGLNSYRGNDGRCYSDGSSWYWWGRWVFAGIAVLFIVLVFAGLFRNSRRRRQRGNQPMYGTGWMAPAPPPYYPPPPQYSAQDQQGQGYAPPGGYKYGQNDGYYGGNQEGIQLQQPAGTYHRGTDADYAPPSGPEYAPPPGPPPNAAK
ncbi:chitin synthesis regulation, resistance to congo red-domain-containing protein [Chaetomidium leptoderma]|uniref:Chitin synthesis regulation, resistance to congo red-domain-containing protein n=1 Tax=Chaetomidium leptoderma TaxID=669021 RepID=A0AAN6VHN0_9PEZI|nr:chitin synthesis regulation, resistance to congo red-domain-containing protein [Chaetomidium leptoderma]